MAREVTTDDGVEDLILVAGGVTPLLAAAAAIEARNHESTVRLLWSLRADDISLVQQLLKREPMLGPLTELFVTGGRLAVDVHAALEGRRSCSISAAWTSRTYVRLATPLAAGFVLSAGRALTSAVQSWTTKDDFSIQSLDC